LGTRDKIPSLAILESVLDSVNVGILVLNREGTIVLYNNECARIDGLNRSDVLGQKLLEVYPSLTPESSMLYRVMRTGKPALNITQTFTNFRGRATTIVSSTYPVFDRGEIWGGLEICQDIHLARETHEKIIELQAELAQALEENKKQHKEPAGFNAIITHDETMQKAIALGRKAAGMDCPVVVYGETGTGKDLFVRAIHEESRRKNSPLISQNCAALPETLLEAALFGTTRGSFTGAQDRPGLFELADKGTLFLDEVISAPVVLQAKLLRILEDMTLRRVGGTTPIKVDVRVVASLNVRPEEAISKGLLREDFFYRLAVIFIELTPLRKRQGDIPLLVKHFLGPSGKELSPEAMKFVKAHNWPGNVRELKNMLESAAALAKGSIIDTEHFSILKNISYTGINIHWNEEKVKSSEQIRNEKPNLQELMDNHERQIIESALKNYGGNVAAAARSLGVPRQTLWSKVKRLGINPEELLNW
jgi:arginine utilization regulatory protein